MFRCYWMNITYLPHKAVAEVSKDKEPIGRECAEFNWFESQLMSDSNELRVKWFGCHLIWNSNDFGCQLIWDSIDLVVNWFEIQMIWLSIDVCFKWFWLSVDLNFKWCGSKTKLFCETSFKIEALKIKNEAFLRDFLQNRSFEHQKRSTSARLPSKMKLWRSKTKHFSETSFKIEALKIKNEAFLRDFLQNGSFEAFLRDFLQKWSFEVQKRSISARLPSKMTCRPDTWPQNYNSFNDFEVNASKVLRLPRKSWAEAYEVL